MAANGISTLEFKRDRQDAKLALASTARGNSGRPATLDATQLPTRYGVGDNSAAAIINNPNTGGLLPGRPWAAELQRQVDLKTFIESADTYVVSGDSTRDTAYNDMQAYYTRMLGKAGILAVDNSASGVSGQQWAEDTGSVGVTSAIASIPGTGSTTVLEWSFGINDITDGTEDAATIAALWTPGLDALLVAKPDVSLIFVQPSAVANAARNVKLNEIYEILRDTYSVHVVKAYQPMRDIYDGLTDNIFYFDSTHPDFTGSIRLANIIFSDVLPDSLLSTVLLDNQHYTGAASDTIITAFDSTDIRDGEFWNSSGLISANAAWACFRIADISFGQTVRIFHNGDRDDIRITSGGTGADNVGATLLLTRSTPDEGATPAEYSYTITTLGTERVGATIRSDSSATVGDEYLRVVDVVYAKVGSDLTQAELNVGVTMRLSL